MGGGGGGAVMRSMAARFNAPSIVNGGFRKFPTMLTPAENLPCGKTGLTGSLSVSSTEEAKTNIGSLLDSYLVVQRPCWDLDDDDELQVRQKAVMPRLVFGGAPTIQEAKAATSDLKVALDRVYLSPENEDEECMDIKHVRESAPESALKAFRLLSDDPAVQNVVASIASDPNVWQAVQQNEALMEYLKLNSKNAEELFDEKSSDDESSSDSEKSIESWDNFADFLQSIKNKVMKMVSAVSTYLQSIFEDSGAGKTGEGRANGSDGLTLMEGVMTSGLTGLAIMAILVVVTKRG